MHRALIQKGKKTAVLSLNLMDWAAPHLNLGYAWMYELTNLCLRGVRKFQHSKTKAA